MNCRHMFYFVLLIIGLTNLALGYAVASHFGFGPMPADELAVALSQAASEKPSFAILGGSSDETPLSELPPAKPIEVPAATEQSTEPDIATPTMPSDAADTAIEGTTPAEVLDFTTLSGVTTAHNTNDNTHENTDVNDNSDGDNSHNHIDGAVTNGVSNEDANDGEPGTD